MEPAEEFKYMKKTEELPEGYVYAPWVPISTASYINNVQVWDYRWWKNILCKINWFFHFRLRKRFRSYNRKKIDSSFYDTFKKNMNMKKEILFFIIMLFTLLGCNKPDRIERQDSDYIYVWKYDKEGDSTLLRYSQPVYREFKVMGGHHKNHHIRVDWDNDGRYVCCQLPYDGSVDRCKTVEIAQQAEYCGKPIIGVFQEVFYPNHYFVFIKYK